MIYKLPLLSVKVLASDISSLAQGAILFIPTLPLLIALNASPPQGTKEIYQALPAFRFIEPTNAVPETPISIFAVLSIPINLLRFPQIVSKSIYFHAFIIAEASVAVSGSDEV